MNSILLPLFPMAPEVLGIFVLSAVLYVCLIFTSITVLTRIKSKCENNPTGAEELNGEIEKSLPKTS